MCTPYGCACATGRSGAACDEQVGVASWKWAWREEGEGGARPRGAPPPAAAHSLLTYKDDLLRVGGETFADAPFLYK